MQTFLPYPDFEETAKALDYKRLGKQRIEALECLYVNYRHKGVDLREEFEMSDKYAEYTWKRFENHPCAKMWYCWEGCLFEYAITMCTEWKARGYNDNTLLKLLKAQSLVEWNLYTPFWLGDNEFHNMHKRVLLDKNYEHYVNLWPDLKPAKKIDGRWPYIWPV